MLHHHTNFGYRRSAAEEISSTGILDLFCGLDLIHNKAIQSFHMKIHLWWCTIWNFAVTLTFNTTIQLIHKTLWFMIMYYQTKFDIKRISSSKDTVNIVIFWSYEHLHNDASQYQVWKQNAWRFRDSLLIKNAQEEDCAFYMWSLLLWMYFTWSKCSTFI